MHWEFFLGWGQESQLNIERFEFRVYKKNVVDDGLLPRDAAICPRVMDQTIDW